MAVKRRRTTARYAGGFTAIANEHMRIRHDDRGAFVVLMEFYGRAAYEPRDAREATRAERPERIFFGRIHDSCGGATTWR